jgi:hypothetical protein
MTETERKQDSVPPLQINVCHFNTCVNRLYFQCSRSSHMLAVAIPMRDSACRYALYDRLRSRQTGMSYGLSDPSLFIFEVILLAWVKEWGGEI